MTICQYVPRFENKKLIISQTKAFIDQIKIFLNEQESCVINGGITAKYFKFEKSARQDKSVSACLFILRL